MIPRFQRVLYWVLVGGILLMALLLLRGCVRNRERIAAMRDESPIAAPSDVPDEDAQIALANDADGSVSLDQVSLALPPDPGQKAKVLLERTLADMALANSTHVVPSGPAVTDVFFVALPVVTPNASQVSSEVTDAGEMQQGARRGMAAMTPYGNNHNAGAMLAVVNLSKTWADAHPSGIESEDLTLRAMIATLHANFPEVEEVRFVVDGQTRATLAGHADLTRPYSVEDPVRSIHVLAADGSPI